LYGELMKIGAEKARCEAERKWNTLEYCKRGYFKIFLGIHEFSKGVLKVEKLLPVNDDNLWQFQRCSRRVRVFLTTYSSRERGSLGAWAKQKRREDQWISGSVVEGAPTEEPRPDANNARSQQPATRAIGVSRALACVLNTRAFPQVFCTAPVIHPVRVHKYPWQAS
jgi:hypothetical protein